MALLVQPRYVVYHIHISHIIHHISYLMSQLSLHQLNLIFSHFSFINFISGTLVLSWLEERVPTSSSPHPPSPPVVGVLTVDAMGSHGYSWHMREGRRRKRRDEKVLSIVFISCSGRRLLLTVLYY